MQCGNCQQALSLLTETFDDGFGRYYNMSGSMARSWLFLSHSLFDRFDSVGSPRSTFLCPSCIIGKVLPAYRPSLKRWNLGLVVAYRRETGKFCLLFEYTVQEWLTLDKAPFEAYTAYHRHCRQHQPEPQQKNTVSFDEFWPNDDLSWTSGPKPHVAVQEERSSSHTPVPVTINIAQMESPVAEPPVLAEVNNTHQHLPMMSHVLVAPTSHVKTFCGGQLKAAPRHWSEAEDRILLRAVMQSSLPLKWAQVATMVPNRSGKQCRERYFNHLHNKVKATEWSPLEDAMICRLNKVIGSKWVEICRLMPGRSDNSCKNRWHYLRRHFEKFVSGLPNEGNSAPVSPLKTRLQQLVRASGNEHDEMDKAVTKALIHMIDSPKAIGWPLPQHSLSFGPFEQPDDMAFCIRCGLAACSAQTGPICRSTKWCWACTMTPAVLHDDMLRLEHHIRATSRKYEPQSNDRERRVFK